MPAATQQEAPKNKGGRPRLGAERKIRQGYAIPPEMVRELAIIAKERGVSASALMTEAVALIIKQSKTMAL